MKKVLLFIITLFIGSIVYATELDVEEEIISFPNLDGYGMQAFTTVKDKLFITFINEDESESFIKIYDLNDYSLYKEFPFKSIGHANDVTYNNKTNEILVLHGGGTHVLSVFDGDTFEFKKHITVPLPIRSISYVEDYDTYVVRTVEAGFKLNNDYSKIGIFPFIAAMDFSYDVARQGWTYYKGLIYYATWSWIKLGGDGTNTIFVYDYNGHPRDELITKDNIGELEDVAFYNDKMILGFNGYDNNIKYYLVEVPEIPEPVPDFSETKEITIDQKRNTYSYVISGLAILIGLYLLIKKTTFEM